MINVKHFTKSWYEITLPLILNHSCSAKSRSPRTVKRHSMERSTAAVSCFTVSVSFLKNEDNSFLFVVIKWIKHVKSISEIFYILFCTKSSKPIVCLSSQHASLWTSYISSSVSTATCDPWLPAGQRRSRTAPVFSQDPLTLAKEKKKKVKT